MTHPIPIAALDDRHAFVGTAGSGKTYSAGTAVERILDRHGRTVIVDPLGVWWGLRLLADGRTPSPYNVVIFGGEHGDLPVNEQAGALIGETVATMAESCIVDLSGLGTKASERRFMLAFLTALYRRTNGEPVHIVFDEADMWAPQRLLDKEADAAKLLGMMETVVRRGRIKGFIPWLITQRPAVVSKDVLSQVDGLVAFKLTSSQDRDALGDWVKGSADVEQWKGIWASLPTKQQGEAVVWVPGRGILATAKFPAKQTFDSSRTPKRGEKKREANLKPIDLGALKERLSTVEAETKANDPKALRAEIATLRRELSKAAQNITENITDPKVIEEAYQRGFTEGIEKAQWAVVSKVRELGESYGELVTALNSTKKALDSFLTEGWKRDIPKPRPVAPRPTQQNPKISAIRQPAARSNGHGDPSLTGPQRRVLASVAFWKSIGHDSPTREQVAAVAGYSPSSGGFNNLVGSLRTAGHLDIPMAGRMALTPTADADIPSLEEAREKMRDVLSGPQKKIVDAALSVDGAVSRAAIAEATAYSESSGGFNNLIGSLCTLGILTKPGAGHVAVSDWAREVLA